MNVSSSRLIPSSRLLSGPNPNSGEIFLPVVRYGEVFGQSLSLDLYGSSVLVGLNARDPRAPARVIRTLLASGIASVFGQVNEVIQASRSGANRG